MPRAKERIFNFVYIPFIYKLLIAQGNIKYQHFKIAIQCKTLIQWHPIFLDQVPQQHSTSDYHIFQTLSPTYQDQGYKGNVLFLKLKISIQKKH